MRNWSYRYIGEDGIERTCLRGRAPSLRVTDIPVSIIVVGRHPESPAGKPDAVKVARPVWSGGKAARPYLSLRGGAGNGPRCSVPRQSLTRQTAFQELEGHLHSEINSLGYPKAALFGFCVALVAYNVLAVVKAALRSVHGEKKIANEVSGYYLTGHLQRTYEGMMISIPEEQWIIFQAMSAEKFVSTLQQLAQKVNLAKFKKHKRGPKGPRQKRTRDKDQPHVSTARLLKQ